MATWPRDVALLLAAGLLALGLAPLLGQPGWQTPGVLLCLLAAIARGILGRRASIRADLNDRLVEALSPALGVRAPDRRVVRLSKWTQGWPGEPRKVLLKYAPGITDDDPTWRTELVKTVGRRLLANYQVARHDRRKLRLHLVLAADGDGADKTPALQARAERTIKELLGPTATLADVEWNGQELKALEVKHEAGVKLSSPAYRTRIERVVSTMLPGRWRAKWDLLEDSVRFELRPPLPGKVDHPTPVLDKEHLYKIPMAISEDGAITSWNLKGTGPHAAIAGKTGSGKTVVINGLVMEFCYRGWPVRICDPKRIEFMGMRGWPNVEIVATTVEDQVAVIYQTWKEMESRYEQIENGTATEDDFEPMLLVLDEYRDFVGMASAWYASIKVQGMPTKCPAFEWVSSIARKGRSARIHVLLGTQRPDSEFMGGETRDNFATRASLGPLSPQGAMMMWEAAYIGVAVPRGKPGRGTAVDDSDRPVEIQAYWTPDPRRLRADDAEDRAILERLHPATVDHPQLRVELSDDLFTDLDDDGSKAPTAAQLEKQMRMAQWESVMDSRLVPVDSPVPDPLAGAPRSVAATLARDPLATASTAPGKPDPTPAGPLEAIREVWPSLFRECTEAARHRMDSPVASVLHARRALELLIAAVYGEAKLAAPADGDLIARINAPAFTAWCGRSVIDLMHAIRKAGNSAAHPGNEVSVKSATDILNALEHVVLFAHRELLGSSPAATGDADAEIDEAALLGIEDPLDSEYGPITHERASRVRAGDLVLVDETLDIWGVVVADPEPDEGDDSVLSIEWRSDDDDGGWMEVPDDMSVTTRHPLEENED